MKRRQTSLPDAWFIVDRAADADLLATIRSLPPGTGLLVLKSHGDPRFRRIARTRKLLFLDEDHDAVRVHDHRELRTALLRRTPLILLSPIHPTCTHPGWRPIPRHRAAALARLSGRRLFALGGMDAQRFTRIERLGFRGWAGISAWSAR